MGNSFSFFSAAALILATCAADVCALDCCTMTDGENRGRYQLDLDIFYWQTREDGLSIAIKDKGDASVLKGPVINQNAKWDPGFRLGFQYIFPHDNWRAALEWTQFHNHADHAASGVIFPTWLHPSKTETGSVHETVSHWRLHMGFIDALLKKDFCTSRQLMITPTLGVRYGWIRQKFNLLYKGGERLPLSEQEVRMKNKFWGLGIKMGIGTDWVLGKGFSLLGTGALSLLPGCYYTHQDEDASIEPKRRLKVKNSFKNIQEIVEMAIGVKWTNMWNKGKSEIDLKLLWENLFIPAQNQLVHFTSATADSVFVGNLGDLSIQGWTLGADYRF